MARIERLACCHISNRLNIRQKNIRPIHHYPHFILNENKFSLQTKAFYSQPLGGPELKARPQLVDEFTEDSSMADSNSRDLPQSDCNAEGKVDSVAPDYAEIIVIRHGETEWNANNRIQGHLDVALNEIGRQQAAARALETAEIIARSCGGLEVIQDLDLRERHLGDLQGVVFHETAKVNPKAYQAFSSRRTDQEIPGGGESFDQLYQRCTSSLQKIGRKHKGERVVVVTHGGVIRALYKRASPNGRSGGKVLNSSLNVFHLSDGDIWTLKVRGDVSHLSKTGFLKSGFGGDSTSG
ncbi:phosphoglycerate mutase-like protein 4 isoform X2 [Cornus florida]|uniref:phosphoglycerate mutase-like protein 4 isoform X2 n=1 Tax=Cornus florida TaxID=4283 RepID=UPI00289E759B|nr:phosphoglycerate mutase-like protein 4 isoform X2 [Cornus florida]